MGFIVRRKSMSSIVTMTLDEVKKMPPLSDERLKEILDFQDAEDPDSPVPTDYSRAKAPVLTE